MTFIVKCVSCKNKKRIIIPDDTVRKTTIVVGVKGETIPLGRHVMFGFCTFFRHAAKKVHS